MNDATTASPVTAILASVAAAGPVVVFDKTKKNGVTPPYPESKTGYVWKYADMLRASMIAAALPHPVPFSSEVSKIYLSAVPDSSASTCRMHFSEWIKYHDLKSVLDARIEAEKPEEGAEEREKAEAKAKKDQERKDAKIKKAKDKLDKHIATVAEKDKARKEKMTELAKAQIEADAENAKKLEELTAAYNAVNDATPEALAAADDAATEQTDDAGVATAEPDAPTADAENAAIPDTMSDEDAVSAGIPEHVIRGRRKAGG